MNLTESKNVGITVTIGILVLLLLICTSFFPIYTLLLLFLFIGASLIYLFPKVGLSLVLFGFLINPMVFTHILPTMLHLSGSDTNVLGMWKEGVMLILLLRVISRKTVAQKNPIIIFTFNFMVLGFIFIFLNQSFSNGLMGFRYYFEGMVVFFIFNRLTMEHKFLKKFLSFYSLFAFCMALWSLLVSFHLKFPYMFSIGYENYGGVPHFSFLLSNRPGYLRPFGTLSSPNNYGVFLAISIVLLLFFKNEFKNKLFFVINLVLQILLLVLTFSRSSWIGIMLCLIIAHFVTNRKITKVEFFIGFYAVGALIVYLLKVPDNFIVHFIQQTFTLTDTSAAGHINSLSEGIDFISSHPWGIGLGKAGPRGSSLTGVYLNPENSFFTIAYEMGIIGMLIFIAFNLCSILYLFKMSKRTDNLTHSKLYLTAGYSWIILMVSYVFLPTVQEMEVTLMVYFLAAMSFSYKSDDREAEIHGALPSGYEDDRQAL